MPAMSQQLDRCCYYSLRSTALVPDEEPLDQVDVFEQFGRLHIWGEQPGASRRWGARNSLDHILRNNMDLHAVVLSILELLWINLKRSNVIVVVILHFYLSPGAFWAPSNTLVLRYATFWSSTDSSLFNDGYHCQD